MTPVLDSLVPVFLVLALGCALRRAKALTPADWLGLERLTYHVFTPALIVHTLATADIPVEELLRVGGSLFLAVLAMAGLCLGLARPLGRGLALSGPAFTSLFQGAMRWNTYIGLSVAAALFGTQGVALAAAAIIGMIPLVNLISVGVLASHAGAGLPGPGRFAALLIRNPLVWSSLVGMALASTGLGLPGSLAPALDMLGRAAIGPGILLVGAGLEFGSLARQSGAVAVASGLKLIGMPLLVAAFGAAIGLEGTARSVALICAAVPTASASYILARQMGGDAPLMARIITAETLAAAVTMPLILAFI